MKMPLTTEFSIGDIVKYGRPFYSTEIAVALQEAMDYATPEGIVLSMPELIGAKVLADKDHKFWLNWHTVLTEEDIGIDYEGRFVSRGKPVLITVHGGGILTPKRIKKALNEKDLIEGSAKYTPKEIKDLLEGNLPNGEKIELFRLDDIKKGIVLPRKHGIVQPFKTAQTTKSDYHTKKEFLENTIVIARGEDLDNLEKYFEKAKHPDGTIGNYHSFAGRNPSQSQGRLLFFNGDYDGLDGSNYLDDDGRFVGVAPEAHVVGAPEFIPGEGYVRKTISLKQKPQVPTQKDPFSDWINLVCLTDFQKTIARKCRAELEILPDGERRKMLDKLDIAARNILEFDDETDKQKAKKKPQNLTQAQQQAWEEIAKRFRNLELD